MSSDNPKEDDILLPQEGSTDETAELFGGENIPEAPAEEDVVLQADDADASEDAEEAAVVDEAEVDEAEVEVAEVEEEDEEEVEEGPREPGLTTGGQYLAASCIAYMVVLGIIGLLFLVLGRFPLGFGSAIIVVPISLVCFACSIVGLLAKAEKREKLLLIPTLGPLLPLATIIVFVIAMLNEMKS